MFNEDCEDTGLVLTERSGNYEASCYSKTYFISSKTLKTKKGTPVRFPVTHRKVELTHKGNLVATFGIHRRHGAWKVSDSRQKKENLLQDTEKGYNETGFANVLTRMMGQESSDKIVNSMIGYTSNLNVQTEIESSEIPGQAVIEVQVYKNYELDGKNGVEVFQSDMERNGFKVESYKSNETPAKHDEKGRVISPAFAWQGTVTFKNATDETEKNILPFIGKSKILKNGDTFTVHSNKLVRHLMKTA